MKMTPSFPNLCCSSVRCGIVLRHGGHLAPHPPPTKGRNCERQQEHPPAAVRAGAGYPLFRGGILPCGPELEHKDLASLEGHWLALDEGHAREGSGVLHLDSLVKRKKKHKKQ